MNKLKKSIDNLSTIELTENADVIKAVSNNRRRPTLVIGFAAETDSVLENAKKSCYQSLWMLSSPIA